MNPFNDIWDAIVAKIQDGITAETFEAVVVYKDYKYNMAGFPAVCVIPSDREADYNSTTTDRLTFAFRVLVYYPIEENADNALASGEAIAQALSQLLDIFRQRNVLGPAVANWVIPAPASWSFEERGEGTYRVGEVVLRCVKIV